MSTEPNPARADGDPSTDVTRQKKTVSEKQLRANQENAQKSTGPKTDAGKDAVSKNATKYGIFAATRIEAVDDGTYAEDPEELRDDVASLIDSLGPRDAIEVEIATRLAGVMIRLRRLERWSALRIADVSTPTELDLRNGSRSEHKALILSHHADLLVQHLSGVAMSEEPDYALFAYFARYHGPNPNLGVKGLWTDEREPETEEEWDRAFRALVAHHWPKSGQAQAWANALALKLSNEHDRVRDMEARSAARRILDGPFELETKYESRLSHDLKKYFQLYRQLQLRDLAEP